MNKSNSVYTQSAKTHVLLWAKHILIINRPRCHNKTYGIYVCANIECNKRVIGVYTIFSVSNVELRHTEPT